MKLAIAFVLAAILTWLVVVGFRQITAPGVFAGPNESRTAADVATLSSGSATSGRHRPDGRDGMVWVPGSEFTMGSDDPLARPDEKPLHRVRVDGVWIDATEVTNAQFAEFVEATGYVTTAERAPDLEEIMSQLPPGAPPPPKENLVPGSMVFTPPAHEVPLDDVRHWWSWMPGANWRHPERGGGSIEGRDSHPVVQVSWDDAVAYAAWAGKRLPTEAEWEYAARGGLDAQPFVWGDAPLSATLPQANIWQGTFPNHNTNADGFARTAPITSFDPNGFGLYDMAGNVWEWCSDWFRPDGYTLDAAVKVVVNPTGPSKSVEPRRRYMPLRVQRGGSFLCNDEYCSSYRLSARMGCSPDTGMSHVGFRCVLTPGMKEGNPATASSK